MIHKSNPRLTSLHHWIRNFAPLCHGLVASIIALPFFALCTGEADGETIWTIGEPDQSAAEFALAPNLYKDFLNKDFGWEDRFYLIGRSTPGANWPYVLPGPADSWAGSGGLAGIRTQVLNVLFQLDQRPADAQWRLVIDVLGHRAGHQPALKISINGSQQTIRPKNATGDEVLNGNWAKGKKESIAIDLPAGIIRQGGNHIVLTSNQGGWLVFDSIRLEGPSGTKVTTPEDVFIRDVRSADYEITQSDRQSQPLLIDLECLQPEAKIQVKLAGGLIYEGRVEKGRTILEAPMPKVKARQEDSYEIFVNNRLVQTGKTVRKDHPLASAADYVDPMLGTAHSRWMIAPGPWMPFSMVKLSPNNQNNGWQGGYDPSIESIGGFSHIHEWTMAGLLMMPTAGPLQTKVGDQYQPDSGYRSRIDKASERSSTGYYRVHLTNHDIEAELTATTRASLQRYTFRKSDTGRVMVDLQFPAEYAFNLQKVQIRRVSERRLEGFAVQHTPNAWFEIPQDYTVHFVIEFDQPMTTFGAWTDSGILQGVDRLETGAVKDAGVFVEFDTRSQRVVQARAGISLVSIENAAGNLKGEISDPFGWDFNAVRENQRTAWNDLLERIVIETPDRREKVRFYTNLYRSFCRSTWSDLNGEWLDPEERLQKLKNPKDKMLGCDAFWNTFWNLNQLWNLITPEWSRQWVGTQLELYNACGWLAKGPAGLEYIPVMVAEHEIPLMVGAWQMGVRDFDGDKALEAMLKMQRTPAQKVGGGLAGNRDLVPYLKHSYVPADKGRASNTLEYSFDDWTVAQFAKSRGRKDIHDEFMSRSGNWKNMFDAETGYARLRNSNGNWVTPFDPFKTGADKQYVEGNAWQLTFFVPQDVPGLISTLGRERFLDRLTTGFERSAPTRFNAPNELYWDYPVVHGNQQSMHFSFLFNWAGQPWQTQRWSREIIDRYYGYGTGDAYLGDEDQGQMSAWFVMAALGLFQTDGGCRVDPIFELGSPLYPRVTIDLGKRYGRGATFTIEARNASRANRYIQSATLDGKPLRNWWFRAADLLRGGKLILEMGPTPNKQWGVGSPPP